MEASFWVQLLVDHPLDMGEPGPGLEVGDPGPGLEVLYPGIEASSFVESLM